MYILPAVESYSEYTDPRTAATLKAFTPPTEALEMEFARLVSQCRNRDDCPGPHFINISEGIENPSKLGWLTFQCKFNGDFKQRSLPLKHQLSNLQRAALYHILAKITPPVLIGRKAHGNAIQELKLNIPEGLKRASTVVKKLGFEGEIEDYLQILIANNYGLKANSSTIDEPRPGVAPTSRLGDSKSACESAAKSSLATAVKGGSPDSGNARFEWINLTASDFTKTSSPMKGESGLSPSSQLTSSISTFSTPSYLRRPPSTSRSNSIFPTSCSPSGFFDFEGKSSSSDLALWTPPKGTFLDQLGIFSSPNMSQNVEGSSDPSTSKSSPAMSGKFLKTLDIIEISDDEDFSPLSSSPLARKRAASYDSLDALVDTSKAAGKRARKV